MIEALSLAFFIKIFLLNTLTPAFLLYPINKFYSILVKLFSPKQ